VPVTTKIDPIDEDIKIFISDLLSPEAQSAAFAAFAQDALEDAEATDTAALGYTPTHTTFVDGSESDDLTRVRPDGTIVFVFDIVGDVLLLIYQMLLEHAPVLTGEYRDSIKLYADGTEVDPKGEIPPASQYTFLSGVAYARKIEGSDGRKPESAQAPDGVFQAVATMAQQQYGNTAKVSFAYISPADGGIVDWAKTPQAQSLARSLRGGNKALHQDWLTRVPAIVVTTR
jgi:hypothetical protein